MGHEVPDTVGCVSLRLATTATMGATLYIHLPRVFVLRHDIVPLLIGLPSHMRLNLVVHTAKKLATFAPEDTPVQCAIQRGHLTTPPPPEPLTPTSATSLYYTRAELSLAHRQFGHASVATLTSAFPPHTF